MFCSGVPTCWCASGPGEPNSSGINKLRLQQDNYAHLRVIPPHWGWKTGSGGACVAVFRLLLVILDVLFIILCMIECSGDLEASYSAVPYKMDFTSIFKGRFSSGRKAVRQTPCRIHSGRQSRPHFLAFWPHLLVFLRISVRRRQCVKHAYICGIGVSAIRKIPQNRRIFRLFAGVSRVSGVHTKKSISLQPRG